MSCLLSACILNQLQGKSSSAAGTEDGEDTSATPAEQDRRKEYANKTKEYLGEKFPKERREQAIWRLKKMVIEVQGHADCQCHDNHPLRASILLTVSQISKPLKPC